MVSEEVCQSDHKYVRHRLFIESTEIVKKGRKTFKKKVKEVLHYKTRGFEDVRRTVNISQQAYDYWTSRDKYDKPAWMDWDVWKASDEVRIKAWCDTIAHDLGGIVVDINVLPD